tara:strand:+ start:1131 stop:2345 length:1215 start_codon:yes stop_codon:yes gene_type:complete
MAILQSLKINILRSLSLFFVLTELVIKPIFKYFEYHQDGFRLNFSIIFSVIFLFALIEIIIQLCLKKINIGLNLSHSLPLLNLSFIYLIIIISFPYIIALPIYRIEIFYFEYFSSLVISSFLFYMSGFYILDILNKKRFRAIFFYAWILYTVVVLLNTSFELKYFSSTIDIDVANPNYIMMSDAYALLSIIVVPYTRNLLYRLILLGISSFTLYFLMSRASLYSFVFLNFLVLMIIDKRVFWSIIFFFVASIFFINWEQFIRLNSDNRMFRLITFGNDLSQNSRQTIFKTGLDAIHNNWFFGQYMGDVIVRKNTGTYIHNVFSFWRQFGLIPFILILVNIIYIYLKFYLHSLRAKSWNSEQQFVFIISAYCLVLFLFARSFLFSEIWIVFSLLPTYFLKKKLVY